MKSKAFKRVLSLLLTFVIVLSSLTQNSRALTSAQFAENPSVVIYEAYGGGGNSGAVYKSDYIVLYNTTDKEIDLSTYSIQYASATGTFSSTNTKVLTGSIKAKDYYLIKAANGANASALELPRTPDFESGISMGGKSFKVALANTSDPITSIDEANVVDLVCLGSNYGLGTIIPAASNNNTSIRRKVVDNKLSLTGDNLSDFEKITLDANSLDYLKREVKKDTLLAKLEEAKAKVETDYTTDSFANLKQAIATAQNIFDQQDATQPQVDEQVEFLSQAIAQLVSNTVDASRNGLLEKLNEAKAKVEADYTAETFANLKNAISNAQAAVMLVNALGLSPIKSTTQQFKDVPVNHWAAAHINAVVNAKILNGYGTGKFGVDDYVTRAQLSVMISNAFKLNLISTNMKTFKDVPTNYWAYKEIQKIVSNGIVSGYGNGLFAPDAHVTRGEFSKFVIYTLDLKK